MSRAGWIAWFLLGCLVALATVVELRGCGPTLGDQISQQICWKLGGAWDSARHECVLED